MISKVISDNTEIYGVSIRHILLRNHGVKSILIFLKNAYSYVLSKEVTKLLKLKYYFTSNGVRHLDNRDLYIRKIILNLNKSRKRSNKIVDYLEEKFKEDLEPDYVICDSIFELKFGL